MTGSFTLSGNPPIALSGSGSYSSNRGDSTINLKSTGDQKGASFKMKGITVDAMGDINGGSLTWKAYGQSGSVTLP